MNRFRASFALSVAAITTPVLGQTTIPSEFEAPGSLLRRAFTYFGGVGSTAVTPSATTIYTGNSMQLTIAFQPDALFSIAGAGFMSDIMAPPALSVPATAAVFSVTIESPVGDRLVAFVRIREDDNADGVIDTLGDDDQWESTATLLHPGVQTLNVPLDAFADTNPDAGDNVQGFSTTGRLRYYLVFETRATLPGGILQTPVTLRVDHAGFFAQPQTPPAASCAADLDASGTLDPDDLADYVAAYFAQPPSALADWNADGNTDPDDLADYIAEYFLGCN